MAQQVDVLPTVLDLLDVEPPMAVDGTSLLAALEGGSHLGLLSPAMDGLEAAPIIRWPWKLVRWTTLQPRLALSGASEDPTEPRNVIAEHPEVKTRLLSRLDARINAKREPLQPQRAVVDDDLRERLEALGYAQ